MKIVFSNYIVKKRDLLNAGSKAKNDVESILKKLGFDVKNFVECDYWKYSGLRYKFGKVKWCFSEEWIGFWRKISKNSILFYQWPFEGEERYARMGHMLKKIKRYKLICLIHDISTLRFQGVFADREIQHMKSYDFDYIIVHNEVMKNLMIEKGFCKDKLYVLELFDYYQKVRDAVPTRELSNRIVIAGNLGKHKASYIYHLPECGLMYNLYGQDYEQQDRDDILYKGAFLPEEILEHLEGSFGLVWDGESIDTCNGLGLYLKYNNPHKVSLYIAAGLPIIIWEEAALAKYICENNLGFTIKSISEIPDKISHITEYRYITMKRNVDKIAVRLREGEYLNEKMQLILDDIN